MKLDWSEFVQALPREERLITQRLRELVLETEPRLVEKMNYRVPYYIRNKQICFIWPVSAPDAPKAKNQKADGTLVSFGLCYGNLLANEQGLLLSEGEKQIVEIIQEAVLVDQQTTMPRQSVRKKKN